MNDEISLSLFNPETDYEFVAEWWMAQNHIVLPKDCLPKTGYVAWSSWGQPLAASWLYLTGTKAAIVDFTVANPEASLKNRYTAISSCLMALTDVAKEGGAEFLFGFSGSRGLAKLMQKIGFRQSPKPHAMLFGRL